jgi:predicted phosphodiesterase
MLEKYNSEIVLKALWKDADDRASIDESLKSLDYVFITGDMAFSGADMAAVDEYDEVYHRLITPVCQHFGVPIDRVFIVPGNHDITRSALTDETDKYEEALGTRDEITALLIEPSQDVKRAAIFSRLSNYGAFVNKYLPHIPLDPKTFTFVVTTKAPSDSAPIRIIGLNSAWLAHGGDRDMKKLALGEPVIRSLLGVDSPTVFTIALLHHPAAEGVAWYRLADKSALQSLKVGAQILLSGHVHEPSVLGQWALSGSFIEVIAGSIYEKREWKSNSYNYVVFDTESGCGSSYLRRYCDDAPKGPEWQPDFIATGKEYGGVAKLRMLRDDKMSAGEQAATSERSRRLRTFVIQQGEQLDRRPLLSESHPARDSVGILFPNVYVDPLVKPLRHPVGRTIPLSEWRDKYWKPQNHVLMIGCAGTGKTTALIHIHHQCAAAMLAGAATTSPVFVEARSLAWSVSPTLANVAAAVGITDPGSVDPTILYDGRSIIMLDALDEAFPRTYQEMGLITPGIIDLSFPSVVTCRDDFFRRVLEHRDLCQQYDEILELQPWTLDREVDMFLESYWRERNPGLPLESRASLRALIRNFAGSVEGGLTPLVVTTLLFLWQYDNEYLMQNPPRSFVHLIARLTHIWAKREIARQPGAFQSTELLETAYQDLAWLVYSFRGRGGPTVDSVAIALAKSTRLPSKALRSDPGLFSIVHTRNNGDTVEVTSFLHQAIYEYLLAERQIDAFREGWRSSIISSLLGRTVNRMARELLLSLPKNEQNNMLALLERRYWSLHRWSDSTIVAIFRVIAAKAGGRMSVEKRCNDDMVRRVNVCYLWGRLEAEVGATNMRQIFEQVLSGKIDEHPVVANTMGSGILLVDDARLERAYLDRLCDGGPMDICNLNYHRIYYGDAAYGGVDQLMVDSAAPGNDDWSRTREAIVRRMQSVVGRDARLRSLDLVTFRRLCETRGKPPLRDGEHAALAAACSDLHVLSPNRRQTVSEEHTKVMQLFQ